MRVFSWTKCWSESVVITKEVSACRHLLPCVFSWMCVSFCVGECACVSNKSTELFLSPVDYFNRNASLWHLCQLIGGKWLTVNLSRLQRYCCAGRTQHLFSPPELHTKALQWNCEWQIASTPCHFTQSHIHALRRTRPFTVGLIT